MAKLGRYSADRKKVETVTASKSVAVAECGTIFVASDDYTLTLPTCADAGKGWWIKGVQTVAGKTLTVDVNNQTTIGIEASNAALAINTDIAITGTAGAQVEVVCDGTRFIVLAHGVAAGDIVGQ